MQTKQKRNQLNLVLFTSEMCGRSLTGSLMYGRWRSKQKTRERERDRNENKRPFRRNVNDFENYLCFENWESYRKITKKKKNSMYEETHKKAVHWLSDSQNLPSGQKKHINSILLLSDYFFSSVATVSAMKKKRITRKNCCYFIKINSSKSSDRRRQ